MLKDPKNTKVKDFAITQIPRCCSQGCGSQEVDKVEWHKWEVCQGASWEWNK